MSPQNSQVEKKGINDKGRVMNGFSEEDIAKTAAVLANEETPLAERFRAVFTLRNIGGKSAIDALIGGMGSESALLKHEIAYCLGQLQDDYALPFLSSVLDNKQENAMVRHEAGEALG
jgi:deoxyhypusine monooxygenase